MEVGQPDAGVVDVVGDDRQQVADALTFYRTPEQVSNRLQPLALIRHYTQRIRHYTQHRGALDSL